MKRAALYGLTLAGACALAGCQAERAYQEPRVVWVEPAPSYSSDRERWRELFAYFDEAGGRVTFPLGEERALRTEDWFLTSYANDPRFREHLGERCPGLARALEREDALTAGIRVEEVREGNVIKALRFYQGEELIDEYIPDPSHEGLLFNW